MTFSSLRVDLDAERTVLGAVLVDPALTPTMLEGVSREDFSDGRHRVIFGAIRDLDGCGTAVDLVTVKAELSANDQLDQAGGVGYLASLVDGVPRASNVEHYGAIVRDHARARALVEAARAIVADVEDSGDRAEVLLDRAEAAVLKLRSRQYSGRGLEQAQTSAAAAVERLRRLYEGAGQGRVRYGLAHIDRVTGGLRPGELVIIAARTSVGKTALALWTAAAAAQAGSKVALFSLEMDRAALGLRLFGMLAGINAWKFEAGFATERDWKAVEGAGVLVGSLPLHIDDSSSPTLLDLRSRCRRLKAEGGLDLVVVDYLQLITGARVENRQQQVAEISRGLKALARDLELPVLALAQLNRELERRGDPKPQLADLRESGAIEQDADQVLALYRDQGTDPSEAGPVNIAILKNRSGPTGTVRVYFDPKGHRFGDLVEESA